MSSTESNPHPAPAEAPARRSRSFLPLLIFVVLALMALASLYLLGGRQLTLLEGIYRSIGIFTGSGSWAFDSAPGGAPNANALFRFFAVLAPLVTALGFTELATGAIGPLLVRLKAAMMQRGRLRVALFGLDNNSLSFAKTLADSDKYRPTIYAREADERLVQRATTLGIPVAGSPVPWWLRLWLGCQDLLGRRDLGERAAKLIHLPADIHYVVSFLPTIDAQVGLAARLCRASKSGLAESLRISLLMADRGLAQRLDDTLKFAHSNRGVHPHLIDLDALAARLLLTNHKFDVFADAAGQTQIHLAIYGFGRLGRAVAKEAARLYVTRASLQDGKLRITIIDERDDPLNAWLAEDPGIDAVVDIDSRPCTHLESAGFSGRDIKEIVPKAVTAHIITIGDPRSAFALAVSLRRWLLEPPEEEEWRMSHLPSPIFIRAADADGLGRLVRSGAGGDEGNELPDGIFAFGTRKALLSAETLLAPKREKAACAAHKVYRTSMQAMPGSPEAKRARREAERDWAELPPQLRDSNFHVVDHLAVKARAVGYRLDDANNATSGVWPPPADSGAIQLLSHLEHRRYLAERLANGWHYAPNRCDAVRVHPDLVPWEQLSIDERSLDTTQVKALDDIALAMGKRLAEAFVIGITGHRDSPDRVDAGHVKKLLSATFRRLRDENPKRSLVLLTTLAPGSDSWAATCAADEEIPYVVVLPLPYEIYREDFATPDALQAFHRQIAGAEYYVEMPMRAGRASKLTSRGSDPGNQQRRAQQYAQAGAYIVERAHQMVAVWDGEPAWGPGGTGEVVSWVENGVPTGYRSDAVFRALVQPRTLIILPPRPNSVA
jgi:hypothetical protein